MRRAVTAGLKFGFVSGIALATAEILWLGLSAVHPPVSFLAYSAAGDITVMAIFGAVLGAPLNLGIDKKVSSMVFASAMLYVFGGTAIYRSAVPGLDEDAAKQVSAMVLLTIFCGGIGWAAYAKRFLSVEAPTDQLFVTVMMATSLFLVSGFFINKLYLADLLTSKSLIVNGILGVSFLGSLAQLYTIGQRRGGGAERSGQRGVALLSFLFLAAFLTAVLNPIGRAASLPAIRPHVRNSGSGNQATSAILIVLDTVRADHVSCYGYGRLTTPNIDALARESLRYAHVASTSSTTLPAHASLFTGLLPSEHRADFIPGLQDGINRDDTTRIPHQMSASALPLSARTLAEVFEAQGYACGAIVGNCSYLWRGFQLDQGFHHYDDARGVFIPLKPLFDLRDAPVLGDYLRHLTLPYRPAEVITDKSIEWLEKHADSPFFLFINYMDAHSPYAAPPSYRDIFAESSSGMTAPTGPVGLAVMKGGAKFPVEMETFLVKRYDEELRYVDAELGRLIQWLKNQGFYHELVLVVTADHGESFGEHSFLGHTNCLYEHEVRVPLIVKYPGSRRAGETVMRTTSITEIPNILLGELGFSALNPPDDHPISELYANDDRITQYGDRYARNLKAIYKGSRKYIISSNGKMEAYDLERDPQEAHNLLADGSAPDESIVAERNEWLSSPVEGRRRDATRPAASGEGIDRLKSLGYLH